ncbi:MAG: ABC transporter substrate-binding protein [Oscillospiraceae bacterium]|nr:ABC transporter substrate-binding protein [Oscillospiraceae bacterium]
MKKFLASLAAISVFLSGCGYFDFFGDLFGKKTETAETAETAETEPQTDEPEPYPVVIDGVVLDASPGEIICLSPALGEILYEFGEGGRLTGRSGYCDYPAEIRGVPDMGTGIGLDTEKIIGASPDLLLSSAPVTAKDRIILEGAGIVTVIVPAPKNIEEFKDVYRIMGVILYGAFVGAEEGERVFADISRALYNPGAVDLKNFVYITENLALATGDTLESSVLSCFGNNLAEDGAGYVYDKEKLLLNQPDVIILNGVYTTGDLLADEVFSQLDAVIEERIIVVDNAYFERPSARIVGLISRMRTEYDMMRG